MPTPNRATLSALTAQIVGLLLVSMLGSSGALPRLEPIGLACLQGICSASIALVLGSPRWWMAIHLGFMPAAVLATEANVPSWIYGLGFITLMAIYWTSFRTQAPLFLSSRLAVHRVASWLPVDRPLRVLDVGSGTGAFVSRLAALRPGWHVHGIELAPAPFLLSRWLTRRQPNVTMTRSDYWRHDLAEYDVVYAFLSPVPMRELWRKARREMHPGGWLVSNSFAVPDLLPAETLSVDDARHTRLYCYRIPAPSATRACD